MRKGRDGGKTGKKTGEKKTKKQVENNGHYVIASSRPLERRPLERRTLGQKDQCLILTLRLDKETRKEKSLSCFDI